MIRKKLSAKLKQTHAHKTNLARKQELLKRKGNYQSNSNGRSTNDQVNPK